MKKLNYSELKQSPMVQNALETAREIISFVRQFLGKKKILIISEKNIVSVPVSSRIQSVVMLSVLFVMLWLSYSTGKYFAYEGIISQKDHEIWTTHVTNENLQYQVSDLHRNLNELNKYFENIRAYDQMAQKEIFVDESDEETAQMAGLMQGPVRSPSADAHNILYNIRTKVLERIASLESIIQMTGLKIEEVALNNFPLKGALKEVREHESNNGDSSNQGGPFEPADDDKLFNKQEFDSSVNFLLQLENVIHSMPLSTPIKRYWVSSRYGKRKDPIHNRVAMHGGIDLVGEHRAQILSTAPGVVSYARRYGAYGKLIEIDHGSGITTRYGHLFKIKVKKGQKVKRGDVIGLQGNSGRSTGDHLHYEVRNNHKTLNPDKFLKAGKYVF